MTPLLIELSLFTGALVDFMVFLLRQGVEAYWFYQATGFLAALVFVLLLIYANKAGSRFPRTAIQTFVSAILGQHLDFYFFIIGTITGLKRFPSFNVQWTWVIHYYLFKFWNTSMHLITVLLSFFATSYIMIRSRETMAIVEQKEEN